MKVERILDSIQGACAALGLAVSVLAFVPFVQTYGYLPAREITILVGVAAFFAILGVVRSKAKEGELRAIRVTFLLGVTTAAGVALGLYAIGGLQLGTLGIFMFPPAFLVAGTVILATTARRAIVLTLIGSSLLLLPALLLLMSLYATPRPLFLPAILLEGFLTAFLGVLYSVAMTGSLAGRLAGRGRSA